MIELLAVAAAQAVQTMRLPPLAAPAPAPAETMPVAPVNPGRVSIRILPDLIVSEIRVENDNTAWARVTNQGNADVIGKVRVEGTAIKNAYMSGSTQEPSMFENLLIGESKWVKLTDFLMRPEAYSSGSAAEDRHFALTSSVYLTVSVDPKIYRTGGGWFGGPSERDIADALAGKTTKPTCDDKIGCIRELDENNNYLQLKAPDIPRGNSESVSSPERG